MSVRKQLEKPKIIEDTQQATIKESDIEALIKKGAPVKQEAKDKSWTHFNLRIPQKMINEIDECLQERAGMTRTGWMLEAIQEKLKRSKN